MNNPGFTHNNSLLQRADIDIELHAPMAITRYSLMFENRGEEAVEALFHFTLARMACLMQTRLHLNDREYQGEVMAKAAADERYEEAIEAGKKSLLLEAIDDGLYQINLGNLEPGDSARLELQIAGLLTPQPGAWQYRLPTVIAAKYGQAQAPTAPTNSLLACYPFEGRLHCQGLPKPHITSHALREQNGHFAFKGELDRDILFCLATTEDNSQLLSASWQNAHYSLGYIAPQPQNPSESPSSSAPVLHVLVDCSGSMMGDSIEQVRQALLTLVELADEMLHLNLYRFGSDFEAYNRTPLPCNTRHKKGLRRYIESIQADMGGTEIMQALNALCINANPPGPQQVLLITDGRAYVQDEEVAALQARCLQQHCTLHAMGVSHAADESLLSRLTQPGGQLVLVNPVEPVEQITGELLHHLSQPAQAVSIEWQHNPQWQQTPRLRFGNTPLLLAAKHSNDAPSALEYQSAETKETLQARQLDNPLLAQALVQLAASQHLITLPPQEQTALAVQMHLISDHTSYVLVTDQQVKHPERYPTIKEIAQMHGFDTKVMACMASSSATSSQMDYLDIPRFLRKEVNDTELYSLIPSHLPQAPRPLLKLQRRMTRRFFRNDLPELALLQKWGIDAAALKTLQAETQAYPDQARALMALWLSLLFARFNLAIPTSITTILRAQPQLNIRSVRDAMQDDIEQLAAKARKKPFTLAD